MPSNDELLHDLRRDLQDGDDLATALALVSDAVQRRVRRVQRSLDLLDEDGTDVAALRRRLQLVLDRYAAALDHESRALRGVVDTWQPELDDLAGELDDRAGDT